MTSRTVDHPGREYVLGHSADELDRLVEQGRVLRDLTAQLFRAARIGPGHRVLDVGCGAGDVSLLAASLVGPEGAVIGVDRSEDALELARRRAERMRLPNVRFLRADLADLALEEPVDAVVGRLVLMYFPHPAEVLAHLATMVRPGGVLAFHELDLLSATSEPPCPLFEDTLRRVRETFARSGVHTRMGLQLPRVFEEAGLPPPALVAHTRAGYGGDSPLLPVLAGIARTLLPTMESTGVASADVVAIDTLLERLREEAGARGATTVLPLFVGAWAAKQG